MPNSSEMRLFDKPCYAEYERSVNTNIERIVGAFAAQSSEFDVGYRMQVSAVFSSNIEGNTLDVNSYMNAKLRKETRSNLKEVAEIDDLVEAYHFANAHKLTEKNFLKAHLMLSKHLLIESKQGAYRNERIGVFSDKGLVYLAVEEQFVPEQMRLFFQEIATLLTTPLSIKETLYFAALIHLRCAHIHPFSDGNGRAVRLLEKWFFASKSGEHYWRHLSEKYYKEHQQAYYRALNLGVNFYELDYAKCVPFLLMLPESFIEQQRMRERNE